MATGYSPTKETTNFAKFSWIIVDICRDALFGIVSLKIAPIDIPKEILKAKPQKVKLFPEQKKSICNKPGGAAPNNEDFDIPSLYTILRNICCIQPPTRGWFDNTLQNHPLPTDVRVSDDVERLRNKRNALFGHIKQAKMSDSDFQQEVSEIKQILTRLDKHLGSHYVDAVTKIETCCMDPEMEQKYMLEVKEQEKRETETRDLLKTEQKKISEIGENVKQLRVSYDQERTLHEQTRADVADTEKDLVDMKENLNQDKLLHEQTRADVADTRKDLVDMKENLKQDKTLHEQTQVDVADTRKDLVDMKENLKQDKTLHEQTQEETKKVLVELQEEQKQVRSLHEHTQESVKQLEAENKEFKEYSDEQLRLQKERQESIAGTVTDIQRKVEVLSLRDDQTQADRCQDEGKTDEAKVQNHLRQVYQGEKSPEVSIIPAYDDVPLSSVFTPIVIRDDLETTFSLQAKKPGGNMPALFVKMPKRRNWRVSVCRRGNKFARSTDKTDCPDTSTEVTDAALRGSRFDTFTSDATCEVAGLDYSSRDRTEEVGLGQNTAKDNRTKQIEQANCKQTEQANGKQTEQANGKQTEQANEKQTEKLAEVAHAMNIELAHEMQAREMQTELAYEKEIEMTHEKQTGMAHEKQTKINQEKSSVQPVSERNSVNALHSVAEKSSSGTTNSLVFGSTHQGSLEFSYETRGRQCTCIGLVMLAHASKGVVITSDLIDAVLIEGDKFYRSVVDNLKQKKQFHDYFLTFDELPVNVSTAESVHLFTKESIVCGTVLQTGDGDMLSLEHGLELALDVANHCLIIVGALCSTVIKNAEGYCLFDSHSHGADGLSSADGFACAAEFKTLTELVTFMYAFYDSCWLLDVTAYEILPLQIASVERNLDSIQNHPELSRYIDSQLVLTMKKQNEPQQTIKTSRKMYMRNLMQQKRLDQNPEYLRKEAEWKRKWRQKEGKRQLEKETEKLNKQAARRDPLKRNTERQREKARKQTSRKDPERKLAENQLKQAARQDPLKREVERNKEKQAKHESRQDPLKQNTERQREKARKQTARKDPERKLAENQLKQAARQDPLKREVERNKEKQAKHESRQDPLKQNTERKREKARKQTARKDPERKLVENQLKQAARQDPLKREVERNKEKQAKHESRQDPLKQNTERKREKARKQTARKDPERKLVENQLKQAARQDPLKREVERNKEKQAKHESRQDPLKQNTERQREKARKQTARKDPERKLVENQLKQTARQDPLKRNPERQREKEGKQTARKDPERKLVENQLKQTARQDPLKRNPERQREKEGKQTARKDPERKLVENQLKQTVRQDPMFRQKECGNERQSKQRKRKQPLVLERERLAKQQKRSEGFYRDSERLVERTRKANKRKDETFLSEEAAQRKKRKQGDSLEECIQKFETKVSEGPVYVCTSCHQTWFSHSVTRVDHIRSVCTEGLVAEVLTNYISAEGKEWICRTCLDALKQNKIPKLSVANKNKFPIKPKELELHQLEERLVALRIPFMQIRELPRGGQLSIKGSVVNVPVDIQPVLTALPRPIDENVTVPVKLKKKVSYNKSDFSENVRPAAVMTALRWLMENSILYKDSGIEIDSDWYNDTTTSNDEALRELTGQTVQSDSNVPETNGSSSEEVDTFIEADDQENNVGNTDTLLDHADPSVDNVYTFAPGEGQRPLSLYQDADAEYMAFPTIFCGQRRAGKTERTHDVHYSDVVKWELRNVDRRVANNVPNIFFKMKKIQMKHITDKVSLALRRCKTKNKELTVANVLESSLVNDLVRLDEGYYIFRTLRNSPPYLESRKKDVFAMIRQLGLPTWFASLSSADTKWHDLLRILVHLDNGREVSDEEIDRMTWVEKTKLVQKDPVTCSRYFDHRVQVFLNTVLQSSNEPVGKLVDYFYRVEFQQRGSPHIHMLMWIANAPKYNENSTTDVIAFIDKYVTCAAGTSNQVELTDLIGFQTHKHSKSCKRRGKSVCRFGFPLPPMDKTVILEPLEETEDKTKYKKMFTDIQEKLNSLKEGGNFSFLTFLEDLHMDKTDYVKAIQSSLDSPKVFLKREPSEIRVNPYMKSLLCAWKANHDIQYVLDPYACAVYIVSYINKSQRGMSMLLDQACKEAREGNMDLRKQVRHMGNKFLNSVEVSAQEASYLTLQLPLTKSTRQVTFINTSSAEERTFLLKDRKTLEKMPADSTKIEADNIITRYSKRPKQLQHYCLADYVSQLEVKYPKTDSDNLADCDDVNDDEEEVGDEIAEDISADVESDRNVNITLKNGITIRSRRKQRVIRYVRFSLKSDPENYYRERILLFHPWRNEESDIKGQFETYEQHYRCLKNFIEAKAKQYEHNAEALDIARQVAEGELDFDHVAPGVEQQESDDAYTEPTESEHFVYFNPDRAENQQHSDLGIDIGLSPTVCTIDVNQARMQTDDYLRLVRSLNRKQFEFFAHVLHWVKTESEPLHLFLTGGAGVGKSLVIKALFEGLARHLSSHEGDNPNDVRVLLCAPTGKAAFNVGGTTVHSAFRIPASQGFSYKPLDSDSLNTLRTKYRNLSVVLIDEVSMVGNSMFSFINERLKHIKGSKEYFGGVHMILIGDLYQLPPVFDGWIFENLKHNLGPLATNLWQDLFVMHNLTEIMRQKDDLPFSELLNRLREGNHTEDDIATLKERTVDPDSPDYPKTAPHLFPKNKSVDSFNQNVFDKAVSDKAVIPALDTVVGDDSTAVKQNLLQAVQNKSASVTAGLQENVHVAVDLKYQLTANLDVTDGLTNGSTCTVQKIERKQANTSRPSIVWVQFDNDSVGKAWRAQYKHLYHMEIDTHWTPVFDIKRSFPFRRKTVMRIQFPLQSAAARTVHKAQGDTVDELVVDMTAQTCFPHHHYVACSRVRTMSGLHIVELNEKKMSIAKSVKKEMDRLQKESMMSLCYTPVYQTKAETLDVAFINTRSLIKHIDDVKSDHNLMAADIVGISETWLLPGDSSDSLNCSGYKMYRKDGTATSSNRPHRGIVLFVRDDIDVLKLVQHTDSQFEYILVHICVKGKYVQVATVYRAPSGTLNAFKNSVTTSLFPALDTDKPLIIQGDFNYNILSRETQYLDFMETTFKSSQIVQKPTHDSGSLLDHTYSNIPGVSWQVLEAVWSDHQITHVQVDLSNFR